MDPRRRSRTATPRVRRLRRPRAARSSPRSRPASRSTRRHRSARCRRSCGPRSRPRAGPRRRAERLLERLGGDRRERVAEVIDVGDAAQDPAVPRLEAGTREPHRIRDARPELLDRDAECYVGRHRSEHIAAVERTTHRMAKEPGLVERVRDRVRSISAHSSTPLSGPTKTLSMRGHRKRACAPCRRRGRRR